MQRMQHNNTKHIISITSCAHNYGGTFSNNNRWW